MRTLQSSSGSHVSLRATRADGSSTASSFTSDDERTGLDQQRLGLAVISLQVMQEYFVAVTRKLGVDPELAQRKVELLGRGRWSAPRKAM